jgi:nitroimidazol reductase NimA-like FMN-containing flavoprotein (pyridoxamine 5'-phosphate oxidase superfamily)
VVKASPPSPRARVRRVPARADYQPATIDAILDEALVAHLGFAVDDQPYVIPTLHARVGDVVYVHGSSASRAIRSLAGGLQACLTVTVLDGLVLARSAFHHSMNYRSVVILGEARPVEGPEERLKALEAFTERLVPGRWDEVRPPTAQELKGTRVLAFTLDEASAKVRTGPPVDDDEDYALDVWAGVVPLALQTGPLTADPRLTPGIEPSEPVRRWADAR